MTRDYFLPRAFFSFSAWLFRPQRVTFDIESKMMLPSNC